jgi:lipopolysaccharide/colanic/teichoic acid biosynthesis glycosyltransferase
MSEGDRRRVKFLVQEFHSHRKLKFKIMRIPTRLIPNKLDSDGLYVHNHQGKRYFDLVFSALGLLLLGWLILAAWILASFDTKANGFFRQSRVGKDGKIFKVIKIRTMRVNTGIKSTVTTMLDSRITRLGRFWRRTKIDELPQLINVFFGDMSFVGPRPDVPGFADKLHGSDRILLFVRPGITGPATLKYRDEEKLLANEEDPEHYNREVIWPDKVRINLEYIRTWSFSKDLQYILKTLFADH